MTDLSKLSAEELLQKFAQDTDTHGFDETVLIKPDIYLELLSRLHAYEALKKKEKEIRGNPQKWMKWCDIILEQYEALEKRIEDQQKEIDWISFWENRNNGKG